MLHRLVALALLAACGSEAARTDIEPTLRFADRTDAEIGRLVAASSARDGYRAQGVIHALDRADRDPCPAVVAEPASNTVSITGGCTAADGTAIDGSALITNPLGWTGLAYENRDSIYELTDLTYTQSGIRTSYDGSLRFGANGDRLAIDLIVDSAGMAVRSNIFMACGTSSCEIRNSGLELVNAGGALESGTLNANGAAEYRVTLRGLDTLQVDIEGDCMAWQLDGSDRVSPPCT
jgi:hypothetical protein